MVDSDFKSSWTPIYKLQNKNSVNFTDYSTLLNFVLKIDSKKKSLGLTLVSLKFWFLIF